MIFTFITMVAWMFLIGSAIRFIGVLFAKRTDEEMLAIRMSELCGEYPVQSAALKALIIFAISAFWLISYYVY